MTNEANTFDPTKPVQTRDGRKARIICTDRKGTDFSVLALVLNSEGGESLETYTANGWYTRNGGMSGEDLINIPEPAKPSPAIPTNAFDPTKPVQTRDGRKARILATDINRSNGDTIVAVIDDGDGHDYAYTYRPDGRYIESEEDERDLINVQESKTRYVQVFRAAGSFGVASYQTEEDASDRSDTIGVLKVTVTGNKIEAVQVH